MKRKTKYDWKQVQVDYDGGMSTRDLHRKYGICQSAFHLAKKKGRIVLRSQVDSINLRVQLHGPTSPNPSSATKKKISESRIRWLTENPDKVPYLLHHSSKESYPEKLFRTALESSDITGWVQHYRAGIYEYDFAFLDQKIDVEIDGGTHLTDKVKLIDSRRDAWSVANGWTVIRFTATLVKTDLVGCIKELQELLNTIRTRNSTG